MVLGRLGVSRRILLVLAIGIATPAIVSVHALVETRRLLLDARAAEVRHLDEAAWALVARYQALSASGVMTEADAKAAAADALRSMRYDETNYFFAWDMATGTGIAHGGNHVLEGRSFLSGPDADAMPGVADMVRKLVGVARDHGEGLVDYRIPKAGQSVPMDKIGYSKAFAPWGWAIGTGAYVADIDAAFALTARSDLAMAACLIAVAALLSSALGRDLARALSGLARSVCGLASGDLAVAVPCLDRTDEVGAMARAMQIFKEDASRALARDVEFHVTAFRLETALGNMLQGLCLVGPCGTIELFNPQFLAVLGLGPGDVVPGMSLERFLTVSHSAGNHPGRELDSVLAERRALISSGEPFSIVVETADHRLVSITQRPMAGGGWVATYEDITDRRTAEAKITHMARHDALTGLPNRVVLGERIGQALADRGREGRFAVLCLDLDGFKRVNDVLGHPAGDALLVAVSQRLGACVREGDLLARLGGDEFAIVQSSNARSEEAGSLAERLMKALGEPFRVDGHDVVVGVSVGLAIAPDDGRDQASLLKNADIALYRAKAEGRGTYRFFEADMDALASQRMGKWASLPKTPAGLWVGRAGRALHQGRTGPPRHPDGLQASSL